MGHCYFMSIRQFIKLPKYINRCIISFTIYDSRIFEIHSRSSSSPSYNGLFKRMIMHKVDMHFPSQKTDRISTLKVFISNILEISHHQILQVLKQVEIIFRRYPQIHEWRTKLKSVFVQNNCTCAIIADHTGGGNFY